MVRERVSRLWDYNEETDKFFGYEELLRCIFISHSSMEATCLEIEVRLKMEEFGGGRHDSTWYGLTTVVIPFFGLGGKSLGRK